MVRVGDKVKFTPKLRINDFATKMKEYFLENMNTVFTVKDVQVDNIYLEDELCHALDVVFIADELEVVTVENSIVTDPKEYIDKFDSIIYKALVDIGNLKGIEAHQFSSIELLEDIRKSIIGIASSYWLAISPPSYKVGDTIYVDNEECKIISLPHTSNYGILSITYYNVIAEGSGDLNEFINSLIENGRVGVEE